MHFYASLTSTLMYQKQSIHWKWFHGQNYPRTPPLKWLVNHVNPYVSENKNEHPHQISFLLVIHPLIPIVYPCNIPLKMVQSICLMVQSLFFEFPTRQKICLLQYMICPLLNIIDRSSS